jgi:hypothetical protein
LLLLSGLAATMSYVTRTNNRLVHAEVNRVRAQAAADAGVVYSISLLSDEDARRHPALDILQKWDFDSISVTISVTSESGRIDLNTAEDPLLLAFLQSRGLTDGSAKSLLTDLRHYQYRDLGLNVDAGIARPLKLTDEVRRLQSWRNPDLDCWLQSLTVFSRLPNVAINRAVPGVVPALKLLSTHADDIEAQTASATNGRSDVTHAPVGDVVRIRTSAALGQVQASTEWIGRVTGDGTEPVMTMLWDHQIDTAFSCETSPNTLAGK